MKTQRYQRSIQMGAEKYSLPVPNVVFQSLTFTPKFTEPLKQLASIVLNGCNRPSPPWFSNSGGMLDLPGNFKWGGQLTTRDKAYVKTNEEVAEKIIYDATKYAFQLYRRFGASSASVVSKWLKADSKLGGPRYHHAILIANVLPKLTDQQRQSGPILTARNKLALLRTLQSLPRSTLQMDGGLEAQPEPSLFDFDKSNSAQSKARVRDSFCVFMDILGFSKLIEKAHISAESNKLLSELVRSLNKSATWMQFFDYAPTSDSAACRLKFFTDNLVIGLPLSGTLGDWGEAEFHQVTQMISYYQLSMVLHGFPVRGALSVGPLYVDDDTIFGNALLDAYKAEHHVARDPRIILTGDVIILIRQYLKWSNDVSEILLQDSDGQIFINYLLPLIDHVRERAYWLDLSIHKNVIEEGLKLHVASPTIWSKYLWMAEYHNYFCKNFLAKSHEYNSGYLISSKLAKRSPTRFSINCL